MTIASHEEPPKSSLKISLNEFYAIVKDQILKFQHPISGLFPLSPNDPNCVYSHVRDSVYCATVLWALHRAFARVDDDAGRHYELGQCAVKCMRTILVGWMQQSARLEQFKKTQNLDTCLNSRLDYETGEPIADPQYKNLQMDCVGLFVIQLAQMTASGLQVVYTRDEVAFMQNLIFYMERAYRIPDYGMWQRGTKQNRNVVELNASSIGMAKAALESVSGLNVYGAEGSHSSILLVDIDAHSRNRIIMANLLPRESASKGTDASLIPTLCWPAYGSCGKELISSALARCMERLKGRYGFRRFTRDGYATVLDQDTLYQPGELMKFVGIESEWPMFFAYMAIEHCMVGELDKAVEYDNLLQPLMVHPISEQHPWLPKYFYVPLDDLAEERQCRGSVIRKNNFRLPNETFFLWGQSVYLISQLLIHGCLTTSDLDPLGRCPVWNGRMGSVPHARSTFVDKPLNLTIQVVLISESTRLQQLLATYGVLTQTPMQVEPIQRMENEVGGGGRWRRILDGVEECTFSQGIWPPDQLVRVGKFNGCSQSLGLTGRPARPIGQLGTSRFYRISGLTVLCYPLLFEAQDFYLLHDMQVVIDEVKTDFRFLSDWWRLSGRPTFCFLIKEDMVKVPGFGQLLRFLISMKNGDVHGTRTVIGRAQKFVTSGCVEHLDFLPLWTATGDYFQRLREVESGRTFRSFDDLSREVDSVSGMPLKARSSSASVVAPTGIAAVRMIRAMGRQRFHNSPDATLISEACSPSEDAYGLAGRTAAMYELLERHSLDYVFATADGRFTIRDYLSELARMAGIAQVWCVVRLCAALLSQFVNSLAPSLSTILVCGKQITIGVAQAPEVVVYKPLSPDELYKILRDYVYPHDPVQYSLQQELLLWVSSILSSDRPLFTGIKFIRLGWLLEAMKLQLESETMTEDLETDSGDHHDDPVTSSPTESNVADDVNEPRRSLGACHLYSLPPCMVKDLLSRTLRSGHYNESANSATESKCDHDGSIDSSASAMTFSNRRRMRLRRRHVAQPAHVKRGSPTTDPQSMILFQRQLDGCLGRVPPTFYQALYSILERSPHGVIIGNKLLTQKPTLTDMTPYDLNFIDEVESLLRPIGDPVYRSMFVETVMVIGVILERNHELSFKDAVDIKMFIQDAMTSFAVDRGGNAAMNRTTRAVRRLSWPEPEVVPMDNVATYSEFTATAANVPNGTTGYLAKAALDRLIQGNIDLSKVSKDACCAM